MIHHVISIYDLKAHSFAPPAYFAAKGQAIRAFGDAVIERQGNLGKHPEDFVLHLLGTFDDQTGLFENVEKPTILATGAEFAAAKVVNVHGEQGSEDHA